MDWVRYLELRKLKEEWKPKDRNDRFPHEEEYECLKREHLSFLLEGLKGNGI